MMKKFLIAMLGSIAGFWISLILLGITFVISIIIISSDSPNVSLSNKAILHLKLEGEIIERETPIESIYDLQSYDTKQQSYNNIIKSILFAKDDKNITGIFIECCGSSIGIASAQEIANAIKDFKSSGKWVYAYANNYSQQDYYIASTADSLFINPIGSVDIKGLSATTLFYKNLMDKLGIEAQIVKVGSFKSAVEPFMLTQMSDASRLQQKHYLKNIWDTICLEIAANRSFTTDQINEWADSLILTYQTEALLAEKVVDQLCYRHELDDKLKTKLGLTIDDNLNYITPKEYCSSNNILNNSNISDHIAILYATGDIVDSGDGGIVGEKMVPEILSLAKNDKVKGLILRVNSGGGSAFASEQIWNALEVFKKTQKPLFVSMGDVAASGGYYISCGANCIYAEPTTLTGSIGIFGIIPNVKGLLNNNVGITSDNVSTNINGELFSIISPMSTLQKNKMQKYIENGYELFVKRCAEGRNMSIDSIKTIAEGRVWDGISALKYGLIDKFGGLQIAIKDMKSLTKVENVQEYPIYKISLLNQLITSENISNVNIVPEAYTEYHKHLKFIHKIKNLEPIQCRMEEIKIQ